MISKLSARGERLASALARPFVYLGIHPTAVSLLALPFALAFALLVQKGEFLQASLFGMLAILMDFIDGPVARGLGKSSHFGNYLEGIIDKSTDFIMIGSFVFWHPLAAVVAMGSSFLVSFAKPRVALVIVTDNRDWPGIGERGDKLILLLSGTLLSSFFPIVSGFRLMEAVLYAVALISLAGLGQRVAYGRRLIQEAERKGTLLPYLKDRKRR